MTACRVAILVCTYRRPEGLARLLSSLDALTFEKVAQPKITIVVVDNDGEARLPVAVTSKHPVTVLVEPSRGLSVVRNRALDGAPPGTDFVAFVDDDEWVEPCWLDELLAVQKAHDADVVQGPVVPAFEGRPPAWMLHGGYFEVGPFQAGEQLSFGATGNCLLRTSMLQRTGLRFAMAFNNSGGEDADLFNRFLKAGGTIVAAPAARAYEHVPESRMRLGGLLRQQYRKGNTIGQLDVASGQMARRLVRFGKALGFVGQGALRAVLKGAFTGGAAQSGLALIARGTGMLAALLNLKSNYYSQSRQAISPAGASGAAPQHTLTLISDATSLCGVEAFTRQLSARMNLVEPGLHGTVVLPASMAALPAFRHQLRQARTLQISLPVVAWKPRYVMPAIALASARFLGLGVTMILHEWHDLDWKRRLLFRAYVPFASRLMFASPVVRRQFAADLISPFAARRRDLVPIPPNVQRPAVLPDTPLAHTLAEARNAGRFVVGHFGSIYARKQSVQVLDVVAGLKQRGVDTLAVFIGDFINDGANTRAVFQARVAELGLENEVLVTGFIRADDDLFAALTSVDAFAYQFAEGLTSRRGSVLACLMAGRPVVVNAPEDMAEFDHHEAYRALIGSPYLRFAPQAATANDLVDLLVATREPATASREPRVDYRACWDDAASAALGRLPTTHALVLLQRTAART
jgi:glycosyltransferase involved in cell wall biosynthesis